MKADSLAQGKTGFVVGLSCELCSAKIQMPADETPQLKIGEVSEPIARPLDQLKLVVDSFNHSTSGSMLKVVCDFCQPAINRRNTGLKRGLCLG